MPPLLSKKQLQSQQHQQQQQQHGQSSIKKGYNIRRSKSASSSTPSGYNLRYTTSAPTPSLPSTSFHTDSTSFAYSEETENIRQHANIPSSNVFRKNQAQHFEHEWDWGAINDDDHHVTNFEQQQHGHHSTFNGGNNRNRPISTSSSEVNHTMNMNMASPSSLNLFDYPRKTTAMFAGKSPRMDISKNINRVNNLNQKRDNNPVNPKVTPNVNTIHVKSNTSNNNPSANLQSTFSLNL